MYFNHSDAISMQSIGIKNTAPQKRLLRQKRPAPPETTAPDKQYTKMMIWVWLAGNSSAGMALMDWAELVEEYSNGQIKVEVFPGGQLYKFSEIIEALQSGMIEAGGISEPNLENNVKIVSLSQIPGLVTDDDQANRVVHNPEFREMYNGAVEDAMKIKILGNFANMRAIESYVIMGTGKPILKPADLKDVVRVAAPSQPI